MRDVNTMVGKIGMLFVLVEARFAEDGGQTFLCAFAANCVQSVMVLRQCEFIRAAGLGNRRAPGKAHRVRAAQLVEVKASVFGNAPHAVAAVPQGQCDRLRMLAGHDQHRGLQVQPAFQRYVHHIARLDANVLSRRRTQLHRVIPRELRQRIGQLLKPAVVGEPTVVHRAIAGKHQLQAGPFLRRPPGQGDDPRLRLVRANRRRLQRKRAVSHESIVQRAPPVSLEIRVAGHAAESPLNDVVTRDNVIAVDYRQHLNRAPTAEQRLDQRLGDPDRAVVGPGIAPTLQVMRAGQVPRAAL